MSQDTVSTPEPSKTSSQATTESVLALRRRVPIETYDLPGAGQVYVHGLTDVEVQEWYNSCRKATSDDGKERIDDSFGDAKLMMRCLRNVEGKRLFTEEHLPQLIELHNLIKSPLVSLCMKLCAIGGKADAEILKNFERTLAGVC